jgi:hypothetical protein
VSHQCLAFSGYFWDRVSLCIQCGLGQDPRWQACTTTLSFLLVKMRSCKLILYLGVWFKWYLAKHRALSSNSNTAIKTKNRQKIHNAFVFLLSWQRKSQQSYLIHYTDEQTDTSSSAVFTKKKTQLKEHEKVLYLSIS